VTIRFRALGPVDDPLGMGGRQSITDRDSERERFGEREAWEAKTRRGFPIDTLQAIKPVPASEPTSYT
jgi:hypothetical protein